MTLTERLDEYVRACFTGIWIESHEHQDALVAIAQLCRRDDWRLATWDIEQGLHVPGTESDTVGNDPLAAIRALNTLSTPDGTAVLVLQNFHRFLHSAEIVQAISERLSGELDGKPKVFRDSAVTNVTEFFGRFRTLNVRSSEQLDELVGRAQQVLGGVEPQQLRDSGTLRQQVATQLAGVQSALDGLLVDRPRRNIQRRPR